MRSNKGSADVKRIQPNQAQKYTSSDKAGELRSTAALDSRLHKDGERGGKKAYFTPIEFLLQIIKDDCE